MSETLRPLSDAPARQRALDPRESFIVQAPAGSGKTELLIQRILALLSRVERPEEILAITFTRKAAGEMRARLLQALEGARAPEPEQAHARTTWHLAAAALENDGRRGWDLLQNPARLGVQTIDGFCASLARRLPWVSRFGAHPAVTEDAWPLYRQAADKVLALVEARGAEGDAARLLLAHLDNRLELLRDLLVGMLARRDQWLRHLVGNAGEEERRNLEGALRSLVESVLADARKALPPGVRAELVSLGDYAGGNLAAEGAEPCRRPGRPPDLSRGGGSGSSRLAGGGRAAPHQGRRTP